MIERLRLERAEYLKKCRDLGYKYGLQGFREISLDALVLLANHSGFPVKSLSDIPFDVIEDCGGEGLPLRDLYDLCCFDDGHSEYQDQEDGAIDHDEFIIGYLGGILELFYKIRDQIYEKNEEADNVD